MGNVSPSRMYVFWHFMSLQPGENRQARKRLMSVSRQFGVKLICIVKRIWETVTPATDSWMHLHACATNVRLMKIGGQLKEMLTTLQRQPVLVLLVSHVLDCFTTQSSSVETAGSR